MKKEKTNKEEILMKARELVQDKELDSQSKTIFWLWTKTVLKKQQWVQENL